KPEPRKAVDKWFYERPGASGGGDRQANEFVHGITFGSSLNDPEAMPVVMAQQRFISQGLNVIEAQRLGLFATNAPAPLPASPPVIGRPVTVRGFMDADELVDRLKDEKADNYLGDSGPPSLLYQRPSIDADDVHFSDLVRYTPGMTTTASDLLAVLDA